MARTRKSNNKSDAAASKDEATGEVTETLRIIYYPFTYAVALGCFVLALVMLTDLLKSLIPKKERKS